jgi:hypothetical protein
VAARPLACANPDRAVAARSPTLKHPVLSCVLALCLVATGGATALPWSLDLEAAMVQASRNDVGIPGDSGTRFSLVDDLTTDDDVAFRIRLGRRLGDRQRLAVLYAPLRLYAAGQPGFAIDFNGESFASDADLSAVYQFNSYRLTWSYDLVQDRNVDLALGLTGKVRDAFIELSDGETTARKDDLGFVPLLHLRLAWRWTGKISLEFEADALAAPQGRAEDVLAALALRPWQQGTLRLGYRLLEGGGDGDAVHNFAMIHYLVFGWSQRF